MPWSISNRYIQALSIFSVTAFVLLDVCCFQLCLVNNFARRLSKSEFDGRTLLLLKHLAASAAKLEMERLTELGLEAVAEQELLAPITTAAAAAGLGGVAGSGCGNGGGESRSRRGALSGLEVLWECVLDDEAVAER